jgi:hypothetical protein
MVKVRVPRPTKRYVKGGTDTKVVQVKNPPRGRTEKGKLLKKGQLKRRLK